MFFKTDLVLIVGFLYHLHRVVDSIELALQLQNLNRKRVRGINELVDIVNAKLWLPCFCTQDILQLRNLGVHSLDISISSPLIKLDLTKNLQYAI